MPDERLIHPGEGESEKLTKLTNFEFRVWIAYKVAANDVGVMLASPAPLQTVNRFLRDQPVKDIAKALERMLSLGLLLRFEHGGQSYVCSEKWQDWQRVEYPRQTHLPLPDVETRSQCSDATQALFEKLEGIRKEQAERIRVGRKKARAAGEDSQITSEDVRPHARDRAGNANAHANAGVSQGESERGPTLMTGGLPRDHMDHAFCWFERSMCVPRRLHEDLIRRYGGPRDVAEREIRTFYARTKASIGERGPIAEADRFKFWTAQYSEWRRVPPASGGGMAVLSADATAAMVAAKLGTGRPA